MKNIKLFFALVPVILLSAVTGIAQQSISPEKKALIQELRELTETATLSISSNLSSINFNSSLVPIVEKDTALTDVQKQELKQYLVEVKERIEKLTREYFADKDVAKQISDEVGYQLYDKNFTESELKELIAFYKTPLGQKSAKFYTALRTELGKAYKEVFNKKIDDFLRPLLQNAVEELQKRIREAKQQKTITD